MRFLYLGWFTTVAVFVGIYIIISHNSGMAGFFGLVVGYIVGIVGNIALHYVDGETYYVDGFIDALWKKFFWAHGPQFFGFVLGSIYGYSLYIKNFDFKEALLMSIGLAIVPLIETLGKK